MIIGVDIDDTIADTASLLSEYIKEHMNVIKDISSFTERLKSFVKGHTIDDELSSFSLNYLQEVILRVKPKENVKEVLKELKKAGHQIVIITARGDKHFKDSYDITYKWLLDNDITFDKLINDANEKLNECIEEKVNLMIDDSVEICTNLNSQGIDTILFNSKDNRDDKFDGNRVDNWMKLREILLK